MFNEQGEAVKDQPTNGGELHSQSDRQLAKANTHHLEHPRIEQNSMSFIREELSRIQHELDNSGVSALSNKKISLDNMPTIVEAALPSVASVIAHRKNPEVPIVTPTAADIFDMKRWLGWLSSIINLVSFGLLGKQFDRLVEKKGEKKITAIGNTIADTLELLERTPEPRMKFRDEVAALYQGITASSDPRKELRAVLRRLDNLRYGNEQPNKNSWIKDITVENYPLIVNVLRVSNVPLAFYINQASLAMPELLKGIELFLRSHGVPVKSAPGPQGTMTRAVAEKLVSSKLQRVENELPNALRTAMQILPKNGSEFSQNIYDAAGTIASLRREGRSNKSVTRILMASER